MLFFVYGGLMKQMGLSEHMKSAIYKGPAYIYADLYFLGQFPGVRPGKNKVFGELYEVNQELIPEIDKVEEYYPNDATKSVYLRKELNVLNLADGKKTKASVYWYNREPKNNPQILHGDYRRYIEEKKQTTNSTWIAAYGSNLSRQRIEKRVGKINESKTGFLKGFNQVFNVKTNLNGYAYANIKFSGNNEKCPAVAWKLSAEQIKKLDKFENVPNRYHRVSMPFNEKNGKSIIAQAYIANIDTIGENLHPETSYLKHITDGLKEHKLSISKEKQ